MWGVLALSLLAAEAPPPPPDFAVFTAPAAPLMGAVVGVVTAGPAMVFVPIGVAFTANDVDWIADAAFVHRAPDPRRGTPAQSPVALGHSGTWLSLGPVFHSGTKGLNGLFLSPKLTVGVFRTGETLFGNVSVGGDVGYQVTVGPVYLALVIGISIGLGINDNDGFAGPFADFFTPPPARGATLAFGINLQLFRLGWVF